jgi:hypothetical protein
MVDRSRDSQCDDEVPIVSIQSEEPPWPRLYTRYRPSGEIVGSSIKRPDSGKRVTGCSGPPSDGIRENVAMAWLNVAIR